MSTKDDGGPAFPQQAVRDRDGLLQSAAVYGVPSGLTVRDYFAAKNATALLRLCQQDAHEGQDYLSYCAGLSYKMADAMLKAREQP